MRASNSLNSPTKPHSPSTYLHSSEQPSCSSSKTTFPRSARSSQWSIWPVSTTFYTSPARPYPLANCKMTFTGKWKQQSVGGLAMRPRRSSKRNSISSRSAAVSEGFRRAEKEAGHQDCLPCSLSLIRPNDSKTTTKDYQRHTIKQGLWLHKISDSLRAKRKTRLEGSSRIPTHQKWHWWSVATFHPELKWRSVRPFMNSIKGYLAE